MPGVVCQLVDIDPSSVTRIRIATQRTQLVIGEQPVDFGFVGLCRIGAAGTRVARQRKRALYGLAAENDLVAELIVGVPDAASPGR